LDIATAKDADSVKKKQPKVRYYRKYVSLSSLIRKIKLWPSRTGVLHGIKSLTENGNYIEIITHCNEKILARDSKTSRAARWLRNKWYVKACPKCHVPTWKLEKYAGTGFNKHWGSKLEDQFYPNAGAKN
jgi:pyrrolysyl-tRNA synthetase-like protein